MEGECFVKNFIPIDFVKAIGVPYERLRRSGEIEYADKLISDIQTLMQQYDIYLPIVDTSRYNHPLANCHIPPRRIRKK